MRAAGHQHVTIAWTAAAHWPDEQLSSDGVGSWTDDQEYDDITHVYDAEHDDSDGDYD